MHLSATVNFFNGEELIVQAIQNIRKSVDHVSIVYQTVSNFGDAMSVNAHKALRFLEESGLVDEFVLYVPDHSLSGAENEFEKRRIGVEIARAAKATHVLLMDADEFYREQEMENAKKVIERENITFSCVRSFFHIKAPTFRSARPDTTNVCFICKIADSKFFLNNQFPIDVVDPTRRITNDSGKFHLFESTEIAMYHMCFVRTSLKSKLRNTSSRTNPVFIEDARRAIESWMPGAPFSFPNKPVYDIVEVRDEFSIGSISETEDSTNLTGSLNTILITNVRLVELSGSEVVTMEIVRYFASVGWRVRIFSSEVGGPCGQYLSEIPGDVLFTTNDSDSLLVDVFPYVKIFWVHHQFFPISYLRFIDKTHAKPFVVFNHMSPYQPFEAPILYELENELSDRIFFNSIESRTAWENALVPSREKIAILPNPAPDEYFLKRKLLSVRKRFAEKIAIVSNHITSELVDIPRLFEKKNIVVTVYGSGGVSGLLMTPDIIGQYDIVITIGKTVQYCLACNTLVYVYDHFGGPGFLSPENLKRAEDQNFSGRGFSTKTQQTLIEELTSDLSKHHANLDAVVAQSEDKFRLYTYLDNIAESAIKNANIDFAPHPNKSILIAIADQERIGGLLRQSVYFRNVINDLKQELLSNENIEIGQVRSVIDETMAINQSVLVEIESVKAENELFKSQLSAITESRSWKIVKLLRKLNRFLRSLFRRK